MSHPHHLHTMPRIVAGAMTGTSLDGIDAALARITGHGLAMHAELLRLHAQPLGDLADRLRKVAGQVRHTAAELSALAWELGERYADAIARVREDDRLDLIVLHGQTVAHDPPWSWQLINPAPVAARLNCPVVYDLRQADLAAGGQGAPITPIADWILFRDPDRRAAIINLGGFCNATILPAGREPRSLEAIRGFDICACNQLLDEIARGMLAAPFDRDGQAALCGRVNAAERDELGAKLNGQARGRRSLGTGDELSDWVESVAGRMEGNDAAATAVEAIAACMVDRVRQEEPVVLLLAGGGARNAALVKRIAAHFSGSVTTTASRGVPVEAREALAMSVLGALCADGVAITLPQVTGCSSPAPRAGCWIGTRG